jgi:hypothetical protein
VWYGPLQAGGAGTAYSGPAIAAEFATPPDHLDVAVEGPNHSLNFFWETAGTWYGPLQIGANGTTYSPPSITFDSDGNVDVAAQGPNGSIYEYWGLGGAWSGPLQVSGAGTSFTTPSIASGSTSSGGCNINHVTIQSEGPVHQAVEYEHVNNNGTCSSTINQWLAPSTSGTNQQYAGSSALASITSSFFGAPLSGYEGPGNSDIFQFAANQGGTNSYCVLSGAGTDYSAPGMAAFSNYDANASFSINMNQLGPSNSLYAFWFTIPVQPTTCPSFYGPMQLGGAGTAFSVPADSSTNDLAGNHVNNVLVQGPSNTLWVYWSVAGSWNGPIQLGGPGTTFGSST